MEVIIMKKNLTELVFILDRSGSMSGLEADTIGGFNSMIEKQKKEAGEALVSVVLFDDQTEVIDDRRAVFCAGLYGIVRCNRWCNQSYQGCTQTYAGVGTSGEDDLHYHNRWYGKCKPQI